MARIKIVVTVPVDHAEALRIALGDAGAGRLGVYSHCSFSSVGTGRFRPGSGATPFVGTVGQDQVTDEERIEVVCDRLIARGVVEAMLKAHPYEEPAYEIYALVDLEDL